MCDDQAYSIGGKNVNSISIVLKFTAPSLYSFSQTVHIYACFLTFNIFQNILDIFFGRLTMYNGIGLETARGSGTNGYVQRNLSFLRKHKDRVDYKSEEELKKLDEQLIKQPNKEILDHERKRKVELKCMEMQVLMEEQG